MSSQDPKGSPQNRLLDSFKKIHIIMIKRKVHTWVRKNQVPNNNMGDSLSRGALSCPFTPCTSAVCHSLSPRQLRLKVSLKAGVNVPTILDTASVTWRIWAYLGLSHYKKDREKSSPVPRMVISWEENRDLWYLVQRKEDSVVLKYAENCHAEEERESDLFFIAPRGKNRTNRIRMGDKCRQTFYLE